MHGGAGKLATAKAKERLVAMLPDALARLEKLRDQSDHLPTSMMAVKEILTRTLGPTAGQAGAQTGPVINIGFLTPAEPPQVGVEVIDAPPYDEADIAADEDPSI